MSTRSIVAFETEVGIRGVYVHHDGDPKFRLPVLENLIARDGAPKVTATILAHPAWASLEDDQEANTENELVVEGYGRHFDPDHDDKHFTPADLQEWWDSEYIYVVHPETGAIRWVDVGVGHEGQSWETLDWKVGVAA